MFYLFGPLLFKFLEAPPSWLLGWDCYLSSSQVSTHSTYWIQPNGYPKTSQTPSPSFRLIFIVASLIPPMNPSHTTPSSMLDWDCYLSSSQVSTHSTYWLQTNGSPKTSQTPSPSFPLIFIVASLIPPMNPSHTAPSATHKAAILSSRPLSKTTLPTFIYTL